ncbi:MAG: T9SS type A sorting domain-containing protein [Bacteroidota bacterium]
MKKILLFLVAVVCTSAIYAQSSLESQRGPQCTTCTDPKDYITDNGDNTFTADSAQAYYWQVCNGQATIVGSNTGQTVTIQGTTGSTFSLKVIRFKNGSCIEACETGSVQMECNFDPELGGKIFCNGPGQSGNGNVKLDMDPNELQDISQVTYYYDISNNYPGFEFSNGGTNITATGTANNGYSVNFSFDSNCQTISTFVFDLLIQFNNGCPNEWYDNISVDLSTFAPIGIYPNPAGQVNEVNFDGMDYHNVDRIEIRTLQGDRVRSFQPAGQSFSIDGLSKGIYIVQFATTGGNNIAKKLVIN